MGIWDFDSKTILTVLPLMWTFFLFSRKAKKCIKLSCFQAAPSWWKWVVTFIVVVVVDACWSQLMMCRGCVTTLYIWSVTITFESQEEEEPRPCMHLTSPPCCYVSHKLHLHQVPGVLPGPTLCQLLGLNADFSLSLHFAVGMHEQKLFERYKVNSPDH